MMDNARLELMLDAFSKALISLCVVTATIYTTVQVAQNISTSKKTTASASVDLASLDTDYLKEAIIEW
jgi:hypothetical protein